MKGEPFMKFFISALLMISYQALSHHVPKNNDGMEFRSTSIISTKLAKRFHLKFELEHMNRLEKRKTQSFL